MEVACTHHSLSAETAGQFDGSKGRTEMQTQHVPDIHDPQEVDSSVTNGKAVEPTEKIKEYGGPKGKEPTRFGDWEKNGRCIDF